MSRILAIVVVFGLVARPISMTAWANGVDRPYAAE
jgi:hypothetical protein